MLPASRRRKIPKEYNEKFSVLSNIMHDCSAFINTFIDQGDLTLHGFKKLWNRSKFVYIFCFMTVDACEASEVRVMLLMEFIIQPVPVVNEVKVSLGEYDSEHFSGLGILICNILSAQWGKQRKTTSLLISASRLIGVVIGIIVSDGPFRFQPTFGGAPSNYAMDEFVEEVFGVAKSLWLPPEPICPNLIYTCNTEIPMTKRIAAFYLVCALYIYQPTYLTTGYNIGQMRIKIMKSDIERLNEFVQRIRKIALREAQTLFCLLLEQNAFDFSVGYYENPQKHLPYTSSMQLLHFVNAECTPRILPSDSVFELHDQLEHAIQLSCLYIGQKTRTPDCFYRALGVQLIEPSFKLFIKSLEERDNFIGKILFEKSYRTMKLASRFASRIEDNLVPTAAAIDWRPHSKREDNSGSKLKSAKLSSKNIIVTKGAKEIDTDRRKNTKPNNSVNKTIEDRSHGCVSEREARAPCVATEPLSAVKRDFSRAHVKSFLTLPQLINEAAREYERKLKMAAKIRLKLHKAKSKKKSHDGYHNAKVCQAIINSEANSATYGKTCDAKQQQTSKRGTKKTPLIQRTKLELESYYFPSDDDSDDDDKDSIDSLENKARSTLKTYNNPVTKTTSSEPEAKLPNAFQKRMQNSSTAANPIDSAKDIRTNNIYNVYYDDIHKVAYLKSIPKISMPLLKNCDLEIGETTHHFYPQKIEESLRHLVPHVQLSYMLTNKPEILGHITMLIGGMQVPLKSLLNIDYSKCKIIGQIVASVFPLDPNEPIQKPLWNWTFEKTPCSGKMRAQPFGRLILDKIKSSPPSDIDVIATQHERFTSETHTKNVPCYTAKYLAHEEYILPIEAPIKPIFPVRHNSKDTTEETLSVAKSRGLSTLGDDILNIKQPTTQLRVYSRKKSTISNQKIKQNNLEERATQLIPDPIKRKCLLARWGVQSHKDIDLKVHSAFEKTKRTKKAQASSSQKYIEEQVLRGLSENKWPDWSEEKMSTSSNLNEQKRCRFKQYERSKLPTQGLYGLAKPSSSRPRDDTDVKDVDVNPRLTKSIVTNSSPKIKRGRPFKKVHHKTKQAMEKNRSKVEHVSPSSDIKLVQVTCGSDGKLSELEVEIKDND